MPEVYIAESRRKERRYAGRRGTGRANPFRETKFSGAKGDMKKKRFPCSIDYEKE